MYVYCAHIVVHYVYVYVCVYILDFLMTHYSCRYNRIYRIHDDVGVVVILYDGAVECGSAHCREAPLVTQLGVRHHAHHQVVPHDVSRHHGIHHHTLQCAGKGFVGWYKRGDFGVSTVEKVE